MVVMPVNTVTEKQVMVHTYTTSHSHNRFPYSCDSTEVVSMLSFSHARLYSCIWDPKWNLVILNLGFIEPDWELRAGSV